jgi:predicted transcriptional regulator
LSKRNSPDIIATILEAANGGIGKTRLLTKANLTSTQFKKYVDLLVRKELLMEFEERGRRSAYKTTGRGLQYLALYDSIKTVSHLETQC